MPEVPGNDKLRENDSSVYVELVSNQFGELGLTSAQVKVLNDHGYEQPTPVQTECIPLLLAGRDLIGQSKTGTGKTAAFALPILAALEVKQFQLQALVICPTRELAAQVAREIRKLGRVHPDLVVRELCGGAPIWPQTEALRRGVHIAVGTPGRLLDHHKRESLDLRSIRTVVLDEADRMLDMGFLPDVEKILEGMPRDRQTVLFSATIPTTIASLCEAHQRNAAHITVAETEAETSHIRQLAVISRPDQRIDALFWTLGQFPFESALVFCNFKASVAEVDANLAAAGASVDCIHGDLDQFQREQVLAKFRNGSVRLLIATDVAGRGIDVKDLDLVINYEMPAQPDIFVHRVGRTGRAGKVGVAVSIATAKERRKFADIETATKTTIERLSPPAIWPTEPSDSVTRDAQMSTILISGGRKDKVRPGDILGALTGEAGGLSGPEVGRIEIHDRFSYVAVAKKKASSANRCLNRGRIKNKRFKATLV